MDLTVINVVIVAGGMALIGLVVYIGYLNEIFSE